MEGTIDVATAFGTLPATLHLTALAYQTADGGLLGAQAPAAISADDLVDANELLKIPLEVLRDEDANGVYDRLDPKMGFRITGSGRAGNVFSLDWASFPGKTYRIESSDSLESSSWSTVPGSQAVAGPEETSMAVDVNLNPEDTRRFFRVVLVP